MRGFRGLAALLGFLWRRKYRVATVVFGAAFLISVAWWQLGLSVSEVPMWGWVFIAVAIVCLPYAVMVSAIVVGLIYQPDRVILHEVDPADGDAATHEISPQTYEDLVVVDANGNEIGRGNLKSIEVERAREAYEVNAYDPASNVAEVSWQGEATNIQIRRHESMLEQVQQTISPLARAYSDLHAQVDMLVDEKAQDIANSIVGMVEGVTLPPGTRVKDRFDSEAGKQELDQLPDPEETLDELEPPERRQSRPSLEQPRDPPSDAPDTEGGGMR